MLLFLKRNKILSGLILITIISIIIGIILSAALDDQTKLTIINNMYMYKLVNWVIFYVKLRLKEVV